MKLKLVEEFEITEKALELLRELEKGGYAEYRDTEFENLEEFQVLNELEFRTEESFLARNHNGTLGEARQLEKWGLLETDFDSWHTTYIISEKGKNLLKQNPC